MLGLALLRASPSLVPPAGLRVLVLLLLLLQEGETVVPGPDPAPRGRRTPPSPQGRGAEGGELRRCSPCEASAGIPPEKLLPQDAPGLGQNLFVECSAL